MKHKHRLQKVFIMFNKKERRRQTQQGDDPAAHPLFQPVIEPNTSNAVYVPMENLESTNDTEAPIRAQSLDIPTRTSEETASLADATVNDNQVVTDDNNDEIKHLNTQLLDAISNQNNKEVERLLQIGANVNSTRLISFMSACHLAAKVNNGEALSLLLKVKADKGSIDCYGRVPLHLAAEAGSNWAIAILLGFPEDLQAQIRLGMTPEIEEVKNLRANGSFDSVDVRVENNRSFYEDVPLGLQTFNDEHEVQLPPAFSEHGWTPLHFASYMAHYHATRLLLAAGADSNVEDTQKRTPLDVAGAIWFLRRENDEVAKFKISYVNTIKALIERGGRIKKPYRGCALRIAVKLGSTEAIEALLSAGASIDIHHLKESSPLHECVKRAYEEPLKVLLAHAQPGETIRSVDIADSSGSTVLHAAIFASWLPGVCIALDAGGDVTVQNKYGYTAIHYAARKGNTDVLKKILDVAKVVTGSLQNAVNINNGLMESPLLLAIRSGNLDCVKIILEAGASIEITFYIEPNKPYDPHLFFLYERCSSLNQLITERIKKTVKREIKNDFNMIVHALAAIGDVTMAKFFLSQFPELKMLLYNRYPCLMNMIPVEYAAFHNKLDTYKFLLVESLSHPFLDQTNFSAPRLLDIISCLDREEFYYALMEIYPLAIIKATISRYPLHNAIKHYNRDVILHMIDSGADLSQSDDFGDTPVSLIMEHISKPTEFIEGMFDCYIKTNSIPIQNRECKVTVDYRVLMPPQGVFCTKGELRVVRALLEHDRKSQRKLLAHPLIESFLYLKWKTFAAHFYSMAILHAIFVFLITGYIVSVFYYKDDKKKLPVLELFYPPNWRNAMYVFLTVIVIQEFLSFTWVLLKTLEFWLKWLTYVLAIATTVVVTMESEDTKVSRNLATATIGSAWSVIMMLLSMDPTTGYYVQMFRKVTEKIIKILLIFFSLIIMFSSCFMVQFHSEAPFDGPLAAIVKTFAMMTSEFDYEGNFNATKAKEIGASLEILHIIFVVFMILAAIVLMNLMIGVAVSDVQELVQDGNLRRLERQLEFLNKYDTSRRKQTLYHKFQLNRLIDWCKKKLKALYDRLVSCQCFRHCKKKIMNLYFKLRLNRWFYFKDLDLEVTVIPVNDNECHYAEHIKEKILNKAQEKINQTEKETELTKNELKMEEILQSIAAKEKNIIKIEAKLEQVLQAVTKKEQNIEEERKSFLQAVTMNEHNNIKNESKLDEIFQAITKSQRIKIRPQPNWTKSYKLLRHKKRP